MCTMFFGLFCMYYSIFTAERGCATVCRPSVCPSDVRLSVTFRYVFHILWNTSKIISRLISLSFLFCKNDISAVQGHPRSLILVQIESAYAASY